MKFIRDMHIQLQLMLREPKTLARIVARIRSRKYALHVETGDKSRSSRKSIKCENVEFCSGQMEQWRLRAKVRATLECTRVWNL